jgi:hypothetical protein
MRWIGLSQLQFNASARPASLVRRNAQVIFTVEEETYV